MTFLMVSCGTAIKETIISRDDDKSVETSEIKNGEKEENIL